MDIYFGGIGTAPTDTMTTAAAVAHGLYDECARARSGMLAVSVAGDRPAPDLAVRAARRALEQADIPADEIGALLHANVHPQGPDGWSAPHYINHHTIDQPVSSFEIRNGCVGFFSALHLAACILQRSAEPAVLLTCADNFGTPAVNRWHASRLFLLADGGGALVVSRRRGFARLLAIEAASDPAMEVRHRSGERLFPPGITRGGTLNFEARTEHFRRDMARGVIPPGDFGDVLLRTAQRALRKAGVTLDEIAKVVHDGYGIDALHVLYLDLLDVAEERGIWDFTRHVGHAGPVDQIRGLEHVWRNGQLDVGDRVLMLSDAPGMEAACCVVEICATP